VASGNLEALRVVAQARLPVHDAIRAGVDGHQGQLGRRLQLVQEAGLDGTAMGVTEEVQDVGHANARHGERMDVVGVAQRRAERDHAAHGIRVTVGHNLGQDAAAAVADEGDRTLQQLVERDQT